MGRIIAIDYGKKRTGIAVTDTLQIAANALATVPTTELISFLDNYIQQEPVATIVVGAPTQLNGQPSENMKRVTPFVGQIRKRYPTIDIQLYDERFTSTLAHQVVLQSGVNRKTRQDKALIDRISATIILEDYLENKRP